MQWLQNKKRKEKKKKKRVLKKNNKGVLETPTKKAAKQTVLVVFLPSLERKSTLLFLSLDFFLREPLRPVSGALGRN
jgi:hypothetical protein